MSRRIKSFDIFLSITFLYAYRKDIKIVKPPMSEIDYSLTDVQIEEMLEELVLIQNLLIKAKKEK